MKKQQLREQVLFATYTSLVGNVNSNMRLITIEWTSNSYHLRAFFKEVPNEEDIEIIEELTTEVCSHLPFIENCVEDNLMWDYSINNELLDETVFMTREHIESVNDVG